MRRTLLASIVVFAFIVPLGLVPAAAHPAGTVPNGGHDPVDGPLDGHDHQHGGHGGHLPPSQENVALVGKVDLTGVAGGVADVGAFGNYAYLNAFSPECAGRPGAQGTGVHVVDISDPRNPTKVNFLPAEPNSYVGEGVHVIDFNGRHILLHNNETCDASQPVTSGFAVWDVTDPRSAVKLGQYGDTTPPMAGQAFHTTHSVQGFVWQDRAYAVAQDNQDLRDVDIFDITPALSGGAAVLVAEVGLEDWPGAQGSYANGDTVFHHDMQQKVIGGHNVLAVSYWDAGQVLLNIDDPANPVFITDSDYTSPDPEQPSFAIPEGNSHQSYFDQDGEWLLSTDEDFSPTRTLCRIATGPHAGDTGCGEFGWTPDLEDRYPGGFTGPTRFGGLGCDAATVPPATGPGQAIVFSRGSCFFSVKVENGQRAGYALAVVGQSHGGTRNGLLPDAFICGSQGHDFDEQIPAICIGHRAMHQLFSVPPSYTGPEGADIPMGATGESIFAKGGVFDGWGYVHLHRNTTDLPVVDTYAVAESQDPAYAEGFGDLSVHEVKTDPRAEHDLAYFSYYNAGLRVATFGEDGITEVGHYIHDDGNDFWGVFPVVESKDAAKDRMKADKKAFEERQKADKKAWEETEKLRKQDCKAMPQPQRKACEQQVKDDDKAFKERQKAEHEAFKAQRRDDKRFRDRPFLLMSDRDSGLWIFRYTGSEPGDSDHDDADDDDD